MPKGVKSRAFSAPCFLAIYQKATVEKNNAEQLLPVVLLRAVIRGGEVTPGAAKYLVPGRAGPRAPHTAMKKEHVLCHISISTKTFQAKVDIEKHPQHPAFAAPNICSGVSEDFEVSCMFICFRSWDAVWSFLSLEMQNTALSSIVSASGSDWCLLEGHPGGQEMRVAECLSGYWLAAFVPSRLLLFHMSGRTFALPGH